MKHFEADAIHSSWFRDVDHLRQGSHDRPSLRSADLVLAVDNVEAARDELIGRGVNVSEVFHYAGGPFNSAMEKPRIAGRDPEGRSYFWFASFEDPDGNCWLLQEITTRLRGRIDSAATTSVPRASGELASACGGCAW